MVWFINFEVTVREILRVEISKNPTESAKTHRNRNPLFSRIYYIFLMVAQNSKIQSTF